MLGENIKNLRKQKGYSQETLAQEMNVVRQTVSKWEKNYSVPDALMLEKLAEIFEVSVSDLLGKSDESAEPKSDLEHIASQLAILNDQIARELGRKKRRRMRRRAYLITAMASALVVVLVGIPLPFNNAATRFHGNASDVMVTQVDSEMYTFDEIEKAMFVVKVDFEKGWKGCTLTEIRYGGDEEAKAESLERGEETIVLLSTIKTDRNAKDSGMNSPYTYTDFKWILIKDDTGKWIHIDHGYA